MTLAKAMWAHGHSMVIEYPDRIKSEWKAGFFYRVVGKPGTTNWFHFAIPTPVIVDGNRLAIDSVMIRFRSGSVQADITNVHVYDGETKIASHDGLNLSPSSWNWPRYEVPGKPEIKWGVGISIGVRFEGATDANNTLEFSSVGADFLP
ncbi:MAG TPA: hypothetical protein PKN48_02070 [Bacteroidales bacterium]|nr:hypothetical protein [Bacteroidales bacterium]